MEAITASEVGDEQADAIQEGLGFFRTALLVFASVALFVGAFIIFNTFTILISQRTKELALLRALGAHQSQVMRSVLAEAAITGTIAAGLGLLFGVVMASGLRALLEGFGISLPTTSLRILPRTIMAALGLGVFVTVTASLIPARRAAAIAPMAALREGEGVRPIRTAMRVLVGTLLASAGIASVGIALLGDIGGLRLVGVGALVTFLGLSVLSPVLARPITSALGAPLPTIAGVAGTLGRNNAARNPRRTASTAAALMIGLALVGTFTIMGSSVKASVGNVIEETLRADFTLQASTQFSGFSSVVARRLARDEHLAAVVPFIFAEWREPRSDSTRFLSAADATTVEDVVGLDVRSGSLDDLRGNAVMLHVSIADAKDLAAGDPLRMRFPSGVRRMRVAGTYEQNGLVGDYLIDMATYRSIYLARLHTLVGVKAAAGVELAAARDAIERVTVDFANVKVQDQAELRAEQESQIDQLLGLINALLAFAIMIALLGIVNTLALSVFERTREIGLLRAIGLGRRQTRRMIRWEAIVIGLMGGVLGLATGIVFGAILVRALSDEGIETLAIPGGQLLIFLISAGFAGVLAAIGPARRAARMDVLGAIAYE
jgi:putative ABC transport system permease protein